MQKYADSPENVLRLVPDGETQPVQFQTPLEVARKLRREGLGAVRIQRQLVKLFPNAIIPEHRAIHDWIGDIPNPKRKNKGKQDSLDLPYDHEKPEETLEITDDVKSYIRRLSIVKAAMFKVKDREQQFTNREALQAKRTFAEFQDPHGEAVDLFAQYVVVYELTERAIAKDETTDIEDFFAYAPWKSRLNSDLYRVVKQTGQIESYVHLRQIAVRSDQEGMSLEKILNDYKVLVGVHAHLGLPYFFSWISGGMKIHFLERTHPQLMERVESQKIEQWKLDCNWRIQWGNQLTGEPLKTIPVGQTSEANND